MKMMLMRAGVAMLAVSAASANAAGLLGNYTTGFTRAIDTKEASAVAYNWNTRTLMVTEGTSPFPRPAGGEDRPK